MAVPPTRLYPSGRDAERVAELFTGTTVDTRIVSGEVGAASAVKATYAAWTKGSAALLLTHLDLSAQADAVLRAIEGATASHVVTPDLGGSATTRQATDAILGLLG